MPAPYDSRIVANSFLHLASQERRSLSNMHIQKLVYFAHGYYLAVYGKPLIEETVEAWKFGPVIPGLYHQFKRFGGGAVSSYYEEVGIEGTPRVPIVDLSDLAFLRQVYDALKEFSAERLSKLTHAPDSPWSKSYVPGVESIEIPQSVIRNYFGQVLESNRKVSA